MYFRWHSFFLHLIMDPNLRVLLIPDKDSSSCMHLTISTLPVLFFPIRRYKHKGTEKIEGLD